MIPPHIQKDLPPPPSFRRFIGPSFILLGLGLGSGEIILWPYLTSNHGLGLAWAIVAGITMQFIINLEVERYALIYGESVFVGFARWLKFLPGWFIATTFLGFAWPGIGLAGAVLVDTALGSKSSILVGILLFLLIGTILTLGKHLYKTVETLQKNLILVGTPFIIVLALYLARASHWQALFQGLIGIGPNYTFLPPNVSLITLLGALAFSGAGGNLNLAQSCYIRDKGYGMGHYSPKIGSLITNPNAPRHFSLTGFSFPLTAANLARFKKWWRLAQLEHFLIFWLLGLVTMLSLSLLAYSTAYGGPDNPSGIQFVLNESSAIARSTLPVLGTLFLLITGLMLTATQLTVLDSTSRIITENLLLLKPSSTSPAPKIYYLVLWLQIAFGIAVLLLGFNQPRQLITISAAINAVTMCIYSLLLLVLNRTRLPQPLRPGLFRSLLLFITFLFFGFFSYLSFRG